jgi:hypothetical protein
MESPGVIYSTLCVQERRLRDCAGLEIGSQPRTDGRKDKNPRGACSDRTAEICRFQLRQTVAEHAPVQVIQHYFLYRAHGPKNWSQSDLRIGRDLQPTLGFRFRNFHAGRCHTDVNRITQPVTFRC